MKGRFARSRKFTTGFQTNYANGPESKNLSYSFHFDMLISGVAFGAGQKVFSGVISKNRIKK